MSSNEKQAVAAIKSVIASVEACETAMTPAFQDDPEGWEPAVAKIQEAGNEARGALKASGVDLEQNPMLGDDRTKRTCAAFDAAVAYLHAVIAGKPASADPLAAAIALVGLTKMPDLPGEDA